MNEDQARALGELLRSSREAKGLSYRDLAAASGLGIGWLAHLEAGGSRDPVADRVARVAEALELDPARVDRVSGNYLARSLPTVRTYFRSKGKASNAELAELEQVISEVQAKYRRGGGNAAKEGRS